MRDFIKEIFVNSSEELSRQMSLGSDGFSSVRCPATVAVEDANEIRSLESILSFGDRRVCPVRFRYGRTSLVDRVESRANLCD